MKFNKYKYSVLQPGAGLLGSVEKKLGVLVDEPAVPSWPGGSTVSWGTPGECDQQVEGGDPDPLLDPNEATSGVLCSILIFTAQKDKELKERIQQINIKMVWGLRHLSNEERDCGSRACLVRRRVREDLTKI